MNRRFTLAMAAWLVLAGKVIGASVGPSGYTNDFTTQPMAADWATVSRPGTSVDSYDMDADVNANITAAGVTAQTLLSSIDPPAANGTATWSSLGLYLQTRPTAVRYTALMGKFVNKTGTNATQVTISYLFSIALSGPAEDAGKGTRVYYSLSGLAGTWTNLASLNVLSAVNLSVNLSTNLSLNWTNGANLYLLWADDNGFGSPDPANQVDNFSLQASAGLPLDLGCTLTAPTNNSLFVVGAPITALAAVASGVAPFTVEYFTNSGVGNTVFASAGSSIAPPFSVGLGTPSARTYNIYAIATDGAPTPAHANSLTNTFVVAAPISFNLTAPVDGAMIDHNSSVTVSASVSGGTAPYAVQFYLDDAPTGGSVTSAPYSRNLGALFVGDHSLRATVSDARSRVSNSLVRTIHITGPLSVP